MFLINFCATLHCVPHDVHLHKFTCVYKFCGNKLHDVACVEPDESQIPMVMDRIFMEYYKNVIGGILFRDMSIDQYWKIKTGM